MNCIKCNSEIPEKNINIHEDIVLCDECGEKFRPSDTIKDYSKGPVNLTDPPRRIKVTKTANNLLVSVNIRSWKAVVYIFVSVFSTTSFILILTKVEITAIIALLMIWSAIPLIIFWIRTLLRTFGKFELRLNKHTGHLFIGIGKFGLKKELNWRDIYIKKSKKSYHNKNLDIDDEFVARSMVLRNMKKISIIVELDQDTRDYLKNLILPFIINAK